MNADALPKLSDDQVSDLIDHYDELDNKKKEIASAIKLLTSAAMDEKTPDLEDLDAMLKVIREAATSGVSVSEDIQKCKLLLLSQLNSKVSAKSSQRATVSRTPHISYTAEDPSLLKEYSAEHDDWGWVTASVAKDWCVEYEQEHGTVPPGIEKFEEWRLKFSRKRKKV